MRWLGRTRPLFLLDFWPSGLCALCAFVRHKAVRPKQLRKLAGTRLRGAAAGKSRKAVMVSSGGFRTLSLQMAFFVACNAWVTSAGLFIP